VLRYSVYPMIVLTLASGAPQSPDVPVSGSGSVFIMVTSVPHRYQPQVIRGGPIKFSAVALGADLKKHSEFMNRTTPFILTLKGSDAYVMLRQEEGQDLMFVEVRVNPNQACQTSSRFTLLVVRGRTCGGDFMPASDPRLH
jgi:hypothetical protein